MRLLTVFLLTVLSVTSARAQLQLPGGAGVAPDPAPAAAAPAGEAPKPKPKKKAAAVIKPPSEDSLNGQNLGLNGRRGQLVFERSGNELKVRKLTLAGDMISKPGESCQVEVVNSAPVTSKPLGTKNGLPRYEIGVEACPFSFDVLNGAILADNEKALCEFKAADCRVDPAGVWGPFASALGPERSKEIERSRSAAEAGMRANFKALIGHSGKDKAEIKKIAADQAGFSARREEICRDYANEHKHGFCALRVSEMRMLALKAQLGGVNAAPDASATGTVKKKRKPKPAAAAAPAPAVTGY